MDLNHVARLIDPQNDDLIDNLSPADLREFVDFLTMLSRNDSDSVLKYVARNLRRRVLYDILPAKILRNPEGRESYLMEGEIIDAIAQRTRQPAALVRDSQLPHLIRRLAIDLTRKRTDGGVVSVAHLVQRYGDRCASCGYQFRPSDCPLGVDPELFVDAPYHEERYDALKPSTFDRDLRKIVVDHVVPISSFGSNKESNLRLLCLMCNSGKSDYLGYSEPRFASGYRERNRLTETSLVAGSELGLVYSVLQRDRHCVRCRRTARETELTLEPIDGNRFFLFDNLSAVCYDCDRYSGRWVYRR